MQRPRPQDPRELADMLQATGICDPGTGSPYDSLADLFLGDDAPAGSPRAAPARVNGTTHAVRTSSSAPPVEALILGHLPAMASAWVNQYARHCANAHGGPIGVLRLRASESTVEIVGTQAQVPAGTTPQAAIAAANRLVRGWLIRVEETIEPRLPQVQGVGTITLLTGADEAAVVASYRAIKNLFPADNEEPLNVRVVVMGATAERAADATAKIERAAAAFLGRRLAVSACISKITGGLPQVLFRGPAPATLDELLPLLSMPGTPAPTQLTPSPETRPMPRESSAFPRVAVRATVSPEAAPSAPPQVSSRGLHQAAAPDSREFGRLSAQLPGLVALGVSCPVAPEVELALDAAGQVHLLSEATAHSPDRFAQLLAANAWSKSHAALLHRALASDHPQVDLSRSAVLHLFTRDARDVRHLGDAGVKLHLLIPVPGSARGETVTAPLN